ncbi:MAG: hypothetical protein KAK02_07775 [Desulfobulbaceae bacterium]|nr:hypothetical protein [Desulfobulbaceae bacterium]
MKTIIRITGVLSLSLALVLLYAACGKAAPPSGKTLFHKKCGLCHSLDMALSKQKTAEEWRITVMRMKNEKRAPVSEKEVTAIVEYLASSERRAK